MSAEIIKRHEGYKSEKEQLDGRPQISFNDDGHLVIRYIESPEQDSLIVLNWSDSRNVIDFCQRKLADRKQNVPDNDELPY